VLYAVDIHPAAEIEPGVVIDHGIGVVIGSTAKVGSGTVIYHGVTLGAKNITQAKGIHRWEECFYWRWCNIAWCHKCGRWRTHWCRKRCSGRCAPYSTVVGVPAKVVKQDCIKEVVA